MLLSADLVWVDGQARPGVVIEIGPDGRVVAVGASSTLGQPERVLPGRLILPGLVDAHADVLSALRQQGPLPRRRPVGFLSHRHLDYRWAIGLDPERLFTLVRHALLERVLQGITTVGLVHALQYQPDGSPYDVPTATTAAVIRAAREVGVRICLLRAVVLSSGDTPSPDVLLRRFADRSLDAAFEQIGLGYRCLQGFRDPRLTMGLTTIPAQPLPGEDLVALKTRLSHFPLHVWAYHPTPSVPGIIDQLACRGVLDGCTTIVHPLRLEAGETRMLSHVGSVVCLGPPRPGEAEPQQRVAFEISAGQNLLCLGSLDCAGPPLSVRAHALAAALNEPHPSSADLSSLDWISVGGARSLAIPTAQIAAGHWADLISVDIPSEAKQQPLRADWLGDLATAARPVRDVMVGGRWVVEDGAHPRAELSAAACAIATQQLLGTLP